MLILFISLRLGLIIIMSTYLIKIKIENNFTNLLLMICYKETSTAIWSLSWYAGLTIDVNYDERVSVHVYNYV